ncbi:allophanate hydrolase subunit 1 [Nocardia sp. 2YAB30]|uniref:5-oxoprolinase subunit B family protein n=1 Tax=unclassified Nocardia TaxID=2637762 RepID=UPI003F9BDA19
MSGITEAALIVADCGDSALRVTAPEAGREECWRVVHAVATALDAYADRFAITGVIPTYDALLVEFDCAASCHDDVRRLLENLVLRSGTAAPHRIRHFDIPVVYGGEYGPDLQEVAHHLELSQDEVIRVHGSSALTMRCFGSPGGAPMLDGPAFPRPVPRRTVPRPHVPAGAVAVAGHQAVVSARPAPGGWPVIGRTPLTIVDPTTEPLSNYRPGDTFRFYPIPADDWSWYEGVRHG